MHKRVFLITTSFPYGDGEQFLKTELDVWKEYGNAEVVLVPLKKMSNSLQKMPESIVVDDYFCSKPEFSVLSKFLLLIKALRFSEAYREFCSEIIFFPKKMKFFLASLIELQYYTDVFESFIQKKENVESAVFYTYWHNEATYALQRLKRKYGYTLISRIHGYDLYRERRKYGYIPFKKRFIDHLDRLFIITPSAVPYLEKTYGFSRGKLEVSRLGVKDRHIIAEVSPPGELHIVSCSSMVEVKRLEKIVDALEILAKRKSDLRIVWTHIGTGPLEKTIKMRSDNKLGILKNVSSIFLGALENNAVFEYYRTKPIDVFVNVSDSEGVPVSIMEALSCHIPVIAPDIGGIKDMIIDGVNGKMLHVPAPTAVAEALSETAFYKDPVVRTEAYRIFRDKYDARKNYQNFIDRIG